MQTTGPNNTQRQKRSPLRIGLSSGLFIAAAILLAVVSTQIAIDQRLFIMVLLLLVGVFVLLQMVRHTPKNKQEAQDEAETCIPILGSFHKSKSVEKLMDDYSDWKKGHHTTYTRMHFAEQIINELSDVHEYDIALSVLYEVGTLPLKAREHYDYDKYRSTCEAQLLRAIETRKAQGNAGKTEKTEKASGA